MTMRWLPLKFVEFIHDELISSFGGAAGVRDLGLLEANLARPQNLLAYGDNPNLFDLAAAYGYAIARNHPFIDGNKRTAEAAMFAFLERNGYVVEAPEGEIVITMLKVTDGLMAQDKLAQWLRSHASCIQDPQN